MMPLVAGFEEIEAITIADLLRRSGVEVVVAGIALEPSPDGALPPITGAHGLQLVPDTMLGEQSGADFDLVVLPGGMPGSQHLRDDARVLRLLREAAAAGKITAAICAAPMALAAAGLLQGRRFTCYPGFAERCGGGVASTDPVVVDGKVITANGVGAALPFALELVRQLRGDAVASDLARGLLLA